MEFNDYPERTSNKSKLVAIIAVGAVLAIVIVGVAIRVFSREDTSLLVSGGLTISDMEQVCGSAADVEACQARFLQHTALATESVEACDGLPDASRDNCMWLTAQELLNPTWCKDLSRESDQVLCSDTILMERAQKNNDPKECAKMSTDDKRAYCEELLKGPVNVDNCMEIKNNESFCQMIRIAFEARAKQDPALCDALSDEERVVACHDMVEVDDPDFDGLSTFDEWLYGSDPRNADSDGDGYNDGDEVSARYNPTGPGRIENN
jgi:hypothetical protein